MTGSMVPIQFPAAGDHAVVKVEGLGAAGSTRSRNRASGLDFEPEDELTEGRNRIRLTYV